MNEYALNVTTSTGDFLYQVDCFQSEIDAVNHAQSLKLNADEKYSIVRIEYDDDENEIGAYVIAQGGTA